MDENGKTNLDLAIVDGRLMIVSQFTLYADCRHGNRPSFIQAGVRSHPDIGGFHSARILLYSVDFAELEQCLEDGNWDKCAEIGLLIKQKDTRVPVFDTTAIHAYKAAMDSSGK
jgi:hypothetical protein